MAWPHPTGRTATFRTEPPEQRSPSFSGQKRKRSAPARRAIGERMEARRAKTGRSQGLVHDSCPRRGEPANLRIQEIPGALATPDLQRESILVFRIYLRIFPHTVRMSRRFRRHKLAGRLTVLGDHERMPLLQELHDSPETPSCLRCADHLHAEASHGEEGMHGVEGGQHPKPATPSSLTFQDGCRRRS